MNYNIIDAGIRPFPWGIRKAVYKLFGMRVGNGSEKRAGRQIFRPIEVGDGCWIGANATILPGVKIGKGCIIAAGAVVNKNCEPDYLYAGVPARPVKKLPEKPE